MALKDDIKQVKDALRIEDVIYSRLGRDNYRLNPSRTTIHGKCPFHDETKNSFVIYLATQRYHCFGCQRGGDIVDFVQEFQRVDRREATDILMREAGIQATRAPRKTSLVGKHEIACNALFKLYKKHIKKNEEVLGYLGSRGLPWLDVERFELGYCPSRHDYGSMFAELKVDIEDVIQWGLLQRNRDGFLYNPLFGRIIFPIIMPGRPVPVSFFGRSLIEANDEQQGKTRYTYLTNNDYYTKGGTLFGLDKAYPHIKRMRQVILVEGPMDELSMRQAQYENAVSSHGTSLTEAQFTLIEPYNPREFVFAYDGNPAGRMAAIRGVEMALPRGYNTKVVLFPGDKDPSAMLNEEDGRGRVQELFKNAPDGLEYAFTYLQETSSPREIDEWFQKRLAQAGEAGVMIRAALQKKIENLVSG